MGDDRARVHSVLKAEALFSARRAPLTASYNDRIRPLLDAIDRLQNLIDRLPTIVVMVDKTGKRTLAVVTKADKAPEGLLEKVTADDVNIGLGYVCVRNRNGGEKYEEARLEEAKLFDTHPLLCKIDKSIVGVPVLAQKLTQIQAAMMAKCLPEIVKKINDKLNANVAELKKLPKNLSSVEEAMAAFMQILCLAKESLRKIFLRGEFDEYPEEKNMHCKARLVEMLNQYSHELQYCAENDPRANFLLEELEVLEEAKGMWLPNFLPRTAFLTLLQRKLQSSTRRAASSLINKMKEKAMDRIMEFVEMEKLTDYTCNPEYMLEWNNLMSQQNIFMDAINDVLKPSNIVLQGIGEVDVGNLRHRKQQIQEAFYLKMRITAYWKIVLRRFVDSMALHLLFSVQNLVNNEMEKEIVGHLIGPNGSGSMERILEEAPPVAAKRDKLNRSIKLLRESAKVVAKIMDRIATDGEYSD
ncbi:hypothetical protein ACJRO7_010861 [Eucalyptus globulus]|uniref:GED domain-containing protein n=1 Tax=Eucalyptus globulus TaxID=34317 RepID=A0ABD3LE48_EUCGL